MKLSFLKVSFPGRSVHISLQRKLRFSRLPESFAICRMAANSGVPGWGLQGEFFSVTSTADEISIVCPAKQVPAGVSHEGDWTCLKLEGPFPFSETGILSAFVRPLSDQAIPIFAISTFDTDYVLVKHAWVEAAVQALQDAGHEFVLKAFTTKDTK
jgi:uncharacterized protein